MGWVGKSDLLNAIGKTHSTLRAVHSLPHPAFTKAKRSFYLTPVDSVFCLLSGHCNTRHVSFPLRQHTPSTLFIAKSWLPSLIAHDLLTCFPEKICFYLSYFLLSESLFPHPSLLFLCQVLSPTTPLVASSFPPTSFHLEIGSLFFCLLKISVSAGEISALFQPPSQFITNLTLRFSKSLYLISIHSIP